MDNLAAVDEHGRALLARAQQRYDAPVPSTPGWDVAQLVRHVGRVYAFVLTALRNRPAPPPERPLGPEDRDEWFRWTQSRHAALLDELRKVEADEPVWNWSVMADVGAFWPRRMAQETVVHRWDVDNAAGSPIGIPSDLAADGIDEFFDIFLPRLQQQGPIEGLKGSLHLHATDGVGEWLVDLEPGSFTISHEHAKGDAAVRGTASDLLLFIWNRVPASSLEVFGDASLVERWTTGVRI